MVERAHQSLTSCRLYDVTSAGGGAGSLRKHLFPLVSCPSREFIFGSVRPPATGYWIRPGEPKSLFHSSRFLIDHTKSFWLFFLFFFQPRPSVNERFTRWPAERTLVSYLRFGFFWHQYFLNLNSIVCSNSALSWFF